MNDVTEIIGLLYQRGQRIRDDWWSAYVASLERLADELRQSERFLVDFGHLIQRPVQTGAASNAMPDDPPPIPHAAEHSREEQLRVWQETFGRLPGSGQQ